MGLQRVYLVLLALSIGAILMGSFTMRWGVIEPKKSRAANASKKEAPKAVPSESPSTGKDPFAEKAPLLTITDPNANLKKITRVEEFLAQESGRRQSGGPDSGGAESAAWKDFAHSLTAAELEELADRALRIDLNAFDKELALELLAGAGGEPAVGPLVKVASALVPPAAPEEVQAGDRKLREQAKAALSAYADGAPGAEEAREALARIRQKNSP